MNPEVIPLAAIAIICFVEYQVVVMLFRLERLMAGGRYQQEARAAGQ